MLPDWADFPPNWPTFNRFRLGKLSLGGKFTQSGNAVDNKQTRSGCVTLKLYRGRKLYRPTSSVGDKFQTCLATDDRVEWRRKVLEHSRTFMLVHCTPSLSVIRQNTYFTINIYWRCWLYICIVFNCLIAFMNVQEPSYVVWRDRPFPGNRRSRRLLLFD